MPGLNSMFYTQPDPSWGTTIAGGDDSMPSSDGWGAAINNVSLTQYEPEFWQSLGFDGPAYGETENGRYVTPELTSFLESRGIKRGVSMGRNGAQMAGLVNSGGSPIAGSTYLNAPNDNLFFSLASGALNPFGGFLAGQAASAGLGSAASSLGFAGKAAGAFNGAMTGGINAAGTGGNIGRAVAAGTLAGGYTPDVAGMTGMGNGTLGQVVNAGVKGGAQAALSGGNVGQAAGLSGLFAGLNTIGGSDMSSGYNPSTGMEAPTMYDTGASYWSAPQTNFATGPLDEPQNPNSWGSGSLGKFMGDLLPQTRMGWGDLAQGLAGMYSGYRRQRMAKEMMGRVGGNRDGYLANLRGQLQARDARSGRRSDYSGRETELQAKLAELDSRNAPAMAQLSDARFGGLESMLASGLRMGGNMGVFGPRYTRPEQPMPQFSSAPPMVNDHSLDPRRFRPGGY